MKTAARKSLAKDLKRQAKVFGDRLQYLRELGIVGLATGQKATTFLIILPNPHPCRQGQRRMKLL